MHVAFERNVAIAASPDGRNVIGGDDPCAGKVNFSLRLPRRRGRSLRANRFEHHGCAPRLQALGELVGILCRIGSGFDGERRLISRILMVAVPVFLASPSVHHDVRAHGSNHAHNVFQLDAVPHFLSFFQSFRKTEIDYAREVKMRPFDVHRGGKLGAAQDAKLSALLGTDGVLAAFSAIQCEQSRVCAEAVGQIGEQRRGFVVRMRHSE